MKALLINSKDSANAFVLKHVKNLVLEDSSNLINLSDLPELDEEYFKQLDTDKITHILMWGKITDSSFLEKATAFANTGFNVFLLVNAIKFDIESANISTSMISAAISGINIVMTEEIPLLDSEPSPVK